MFDYNVQERVNDFVAAALAQVGPKTNCINYNVFLFSLWLLLLDYQLHSIKNFFPL